MFIKITLKKLDGSVFFEYEAENNSVKKTLEKYIKTHQNFCTFLVDLTEINLSHTNLDGIDLHNVDLSRADLSYSSLCNVDLCNSNLTDANLSHANLNTACLRNVCLVRANLTDANLSYANLENVALNSANLIGACLSYTHLSQVKGLKYATCSFAGHGERGRQLTAININDKVKLFCGCFQGNETELREFIENDVEAYKASRLFALETVLKLIEYEKQNN